MCKTTNKIKTVPNQLIVKVDKIETKNKIFAAVEMDTLEAAAMNLGAGAFKLWMYFAKNQNGYEFALSSKDAAERFGIKIKQYNKAKDELIKKGYLVNTKGNNYTFHEVPVITKGNNDVITKEDNDVITKEDNTLIQKEIRNITDITLYNTNNITIDDEPKEKDKTPIKLTKSQVIEKYGALLQNRILTPNPNVFWINKDLIELIN